MSKYNKDHRFIKFLIKLNSLLNDYEKELKEFLFLFPGSTCILFL